MSLDIHTPAAQKQAGSMKRRIMAGAAAAALTLGAVGAGIAVASSASAATGGHSTGEVATVQVSTDRSTTKASDHPMPLPKNVIPGGELKSLGPVSKVAIEQAVNGNGATLTEAVPAN